MTIGGERVGSSARLVLPADPTAAHQARRFVGAQLLGWGLPGLAETVVLLTSEVVTNALLHAGSSPTLTISRLDGGVRVAVSDAATTEPARRRPGREATTGRGLKLLDDLADEWGWHSNAVGKTVWFRASGSRDPWAAFGASEWSTP